MEIILDILSELNVTTHNIIYMLIGCIVSTVIIRSHKKISPMLYLYEQSVDLFNFVKNFDESCIGLYNLVIIRSICILAHDGLFAEKDLSFIDRGLSELTKVDENSKLLIKESLTNFIYRIIEFEKHYNTDGFALLTKILGRRRIR